MFLQQTEDPDRRYNHETLSRVTALAQRLQSRHQESLTAREVEEIGAEVGLAPDFIRQALGQVTSTSLATAEKPAIVPTPRTGSVRRWTAYRKAWLGSAWSLPFVMMFATTDLHNTGPSGVTMALFVLSWALYIGVSILLGHRVEEARSESQPAGTAAGPAPTSRLAMLEIVFALQRELEDRKRHAAFLSVDVAGSSEMKRSAPELDAEYSFGRFGAWVAEVVEGCGGACHSSAGDGLMCRFPSEALAVRAARLLQEGMPAFNTERNRLPLPFRIRCGVSAGEVPFEEGQPPGSVHSTVIDRAAVLQKQAEAGDILVSHEVAPAALTELGALAQVPASAGAELAFSWRAKRGG